MAIGAQNLTRLVAAGLIALAAGSALLYWALKPQPQAVQVIYGSGRIEADEVRVAFEVSGRLLENAAIEGQTLDRGRLLARLDAADYVLQADRAAAQRSAAQRSAAQLSPQLNLARHHVETARSDLARFETLSRDGAVSAREVDLQRNANQAALDQVRSLREQQAAAVAQAEVAAGSLALAQSQIEKTRVVAPISGAVLERLVEPGEVIAPGQAVAVLANLSRVKLKVFVSERDLGKLRLGAAARLRVDAFPGRTFDARVARIDAQAQFTPRDIHMEDERSRTVYGVTLEAANPLGLLEASGGDRALRIRPQGHQCDRQQACLMLNMWAEPRIAFAIPEATAGYMPEPWRERDVSHPEMLANDGAEMEILAGLGPICAHVWTALRWQGLVDAAGAGRVRPCVRPVVRPCHRRWP